MAFAKDFGKFSTLLEAGFWVFLAFAWCRPAFSFLTARIQQSNTQASFQIFKSTYHRRWHVLHHVYNRDNVDEEQEVDKYILYTCIVSCVFYSRNSIVCVTILLISRYVTKNIML